MYCRNCGSQLRPGAAFCGHCGTRVLQTPTQPAQAPVQQAQPQYQAPAQSAQPAVQPAPVAQPQPTEPEIASLSSEIADIPAQPEATGDETTFMMPLSQHRPAQPTVQPAPEAPSTPAAESAQPEPVVQPAQPEPEAQPAPESEAQPVEHVEPAAPAPVEAPVAEPEEELEPTTVQPPVEPVAPQPAEAEAPVAPAPSQPQLQQPAAQPAQPASAAQPAATPQPATAQGPATPQGPAAQQNPAAQPTQSPATALAVKLPDNAFTSLLKNPVTYIRAGVIAGLSLAGAIVGVIIQTVMLSITLGMIPGIHPAIKDTAVSFKSILTALVTGFGGTYSVSATLGPSMGGYGSMGRYGESTGSQMSLEFGLALPLTLIGILALVGAVVGGVIAAKKFANNALDEENKRETILERCVTLGLAGVVMGILVSIIGGFAASDLPLPFDRMGVQVSFSVSSGKSFFNPLFLVAFGGLVGLLVADKGKKPSLARLRFGLRTFVETSMLLYAVFTVLTVLLFIVVAVVTKQFVLIPLVFILGPLVMLQLLAMGSLGSFSVQGFIHFSVFSGFASSIADGVASKASQLYRSSSYFWFIPNYSRALSELDDQHRGAAPVTFTDPAWVPFVKIALVVITFASFAAAAYSLARRMAVDTAEQDWKHSWVFPLLSAVAWGFIAMSFSPVGLYVPTSSLLVIAGLGGNDAAEGLSTFSSTGQISPAMIFLGALWAFAIEALARLVFLKMVQKKAQPAPTAQTPQGTPGQVPAAPQAPQFAQAPQQAPQFAQPQYAPGQYTGQQAPAPAQFPAQPQYAPQPYPGQPVAPQQYANSQYPAQPNAGQQYAGQQNVAGQYPTQPAAYPQPAAYKYPQNPQDYQCNNNNQQ